MGLPNNFPKDYTSILVWCGNSYTALPLEQDLSLVRYGPDSFSIKGENQAERLTECVAIITDFLFANVKTEQGADDMYNCGLNLYVNGKAEFRVSTLFVHNMAKCIAHLLATLVMDLSVLYEYKPWVKYLAVSLDYVRPDSNSVDIVIRWFAAEYAFALAFTKDGEDFVLARSEHLNSLDRYPKAYLNREINACGRIVDGKHSFGVVKNGKLLVLNGVREFRPGPWYSLVLVRDDEVTGSIVDQFNHIDDDDECEEYI